MNNITCRYLDWTRPPVETAAEALRRLAHGAFPADFSHLAVVVPTAEAGRLLRARVAELCADAGGAVKLDITQPEFLARPAAAATAAQVLLAWRNTLTRVDGRDFAELFRNGVLERFRESEETLLGWGAALQKCRMSLAAEALDLEHAAGRLDELCRQSASENSEARFCRFREFRELEKHYLRELRAVAGGRPDPAVALLEALEQPQLPAGVERVILIDCADLAGAPRRFLENSGIAVECWVNAPKGHGIGEFGLPDPDFWNREPIDLDLRRQLRIVPRPDRQAKLILELLAAGHKDSGAVGVLDPEVALALETRAELTAAGAAPRIFVPREIPLNTLPWSQLLLAVARLGAEPTVARAAAVWGDPLFADYAGDALGVTDLKAALELCDKWREEHFVADPEFFDTLLAKHRSARGADDLARLAEAWRKWRDAFDRAADPVAEAYALLAEFGTANRLAHLEFRRCEAEVAMLRALVADLTAVEAPPATRLAMLRNLLGGATLKIREDSAEAVEAVGFLELPWRSDRTLLIAGFNDNCLSPAADDPFLPDQAREALGMITRERRRAADAMRFKALTMSRDLVILCGQNSQAGETLFPARLLFQCPAEELPERVRLLFGRDLVSSSALPAAAAPPFLPRRAAPRHMRITGFKSYLEDPFKFYLEQVLGARNHDPEALELDHLNFGTLTHNVLQHCRELQSCDAATLKRRLRDRLYAEMKNTFGVRVPGLVELQCEMLADSLDYFAAAQCAEYAEGWRIVAAELPKCFMWNELYRLIRPDSPAEAWREQVELRGKIDRIDRRTNADGTTELRVLDYKTNAKSTAPAEAHLAAAVPDWGTGERLARGCHALKGRPNKALFWKDLQLPLYALIVRHLPDPETAGADRIGAGYFNLPLDLTSTGVAMFPELEDPETLASAVDCADAVLRRIFVEGVFPPSGSRELEIFPGCTVAMAHFRAPGAATAEATR